MEQDVDLAVALADVVDDRRHLVAVAQVEAVVVGRAARAFNGFDGAQRRFLALQPHNLVVDLLGRHLLARRPRLGDQRILERVAALAEEADVRVVAIRRRHQVEQVEDAAAVGRQVGRDGAGDAAGRARHHKDGLLAEHHARIAILGRKLFQRDGVALAVEVADLDHAGVEERLGNELVGRLHGLARRLEVNGLDRDALAPLAHHLLHVVRLGEADDRAAKRSRGAGRAVAVQAAQPRRRDEEGVRPGDAVVERPRRGVEILDAHAVEFAPLVERHLLDGLLHI